MTREDIDSIISIICPNDEDFEKPIISPAYLKKELEMLALEQESKTGHWIEVIDEIDSLGNKTWHHKCSICGNENSGWGNYKYCPNCGAKMESEVEE